MVEHTNCNFLSRRRRACRAQKEIPRKPTEVQTVQAKRLYFHEQCAKSLLNYYFAYESGHARENQTAH